MAVGKRESKKKRMIISAGEELFTKYGFRRVTVEEICREAGASKMTFYKYFKDKTDLVRCIKDSWTEEGFSKFDEIKALDAPFADKIDLMTRWKMEFTARFSSEFLYEALSMEEDLAEFKRRYLNNIREAQASGELRSDIDPEFLWMVLDKISELAREGRFQEVVSDFGEYQRQLRTLVYFGLLTRPGDSTKQGSEDKND